MTTAQRAALVVGGGIIGMTSAFYLARAGWRVTLLDPEPGSGATWAAAGMIAPSAEASPGELQNFQRQRAALAEWRNLGDALREVTGIALTLCQPGTLLVGLDAGDRRLLERYLGVAQGFGLAPLRVTRESHEALFGGVTGRVSEGLLLSDDAWLDPDQVMAALLQANETLGVQVVRRLVASARSTNQFVEVTTEDGDFRGDIGILATGAQPLPDGLINEVKNSVRPVRGTTVRVRATDRSSLPMLRAYVRGRTFYLVGRPGGYGVMGASSEERREPLIEVGELQRLLRDALDIVPALESATFIESRQGLRPASVSLEPFFEIVQRRWAWSSGHYRHGITLAPLSALEVIRFAKDFS